MDYSEYLHSPDIAPEIAKEFGETDFNIPPQSFLDLEGKIVAYTKNKSIVCLFPVYERQTNATRNLQGGVMTAFLDDTIGPLAFFTAKRPVVTTGMDIHFIRGIPSGTTAICTAKLISRSKSTMFFQAEAYTEKGKLAAILNSHNMVL